MKLTVSKKSNLGAVQASLRKLERSDVLVGWTETTDPRDHGPVGNAQLAFIHTEGSPLKNIPARPILQPAITDEGNKSLIAKQLGAAATATLSGKPEEAHQDLERAGLVAENAVKRWFVNPKNHWAPNAAATIARKGSNRPLIDTGQLRRNVTHVVREK